MWKRGTFLAGLAIGLVVGMRLGRERYEQLKGLAQKVADNPSVQQTAKKAAKTVSSKATELTRAAGQQAADKLPKLTETALNGAKTKLNRNNHQDDLETAAYP
jgi:hypothetical protein